MHLPMLYGIAVHVQELIKNWYKYVCIFDRNVKYVLFFIAGKNKKNMPLWDRNTKKGNWYKCTYSKS